jgi:hypothetical protein
MRVPRRPLVAVLVPDLEVEIERVRTFTAVLDARSASLTEGEDP